MDELWRIHLGRWRDATIEDAKAFLRDRPGNAELALAFAASERILGGDPPAGDKDDSPALLYAWAVQRLAVERAAMRNEPWAVAQLGDISRRGGLRPPSVLLEAEVREAAEAMMADMLAQVRAPGD